MNQKQVNQWIKERFGEGRPLNLNPVLPEKPEIIQHCFSGEQPIGWRRSLIAAGIDPYKITHEHTYLVECALCGKELTALGSHIKIVHKLEKQECHDEYGDDKELSSEHFRVVKSAIKPICGIAHWEQIWSPYYVIDWIIALHKANEPLNVNNLQTYSKSLLGKSIELHGSWDRALAKAGVDWTQTRKKKPNVGSTKQKVIDSLQRLAVMRKTDPSRYVSLNLRNGIRNHLKNAETAYKAAGVNPTEISPMAQYSKDQVPAVRPNIWSHPR